MSNPTKALTAPSTAYMKAVGGPREGLKAIAEYAQKHSPEGVTPRTHVVKGMSFTGDGLNPEDAELRVTTPHEIMRESAYGDFFPEVQKMIRDNQSSLPVPKQWQAVGGGNVNTHVFHVDEPEDVFAAPGAGNTTTGSDQWGLMKIPKPWNRPSSFRPGYLRALLHEAGHLDRFYPNDNGLLSQFDNQGYGNQIVKENEHILSNETDEGRRKALERMIWLNVGQGSHIRKRNELTNIFSELRRENYQQTGKIPTNMQEAEQFVEQIFDEAPRHIDPNADNWQHLYGPDPVARKFGPLQGTRSLETPTMKRNFMDAYPPEKPKRTFILRHILEGAGTNGGRPDAV
jgi:hypothetical protein